MIVESTRRIGLTFAAILAMVAACTEPTTERTGETAQGVTGPTVTTDLPSYTAGQAVTVSFMGMPGNNYDWVGIAVAGADVTSYVEWKYTDGLTDGSRSLAGLPAGDYEARAYLDNSFTLLATSTPFTVTGVAPPPPATVTTDQQAYAANSTVTLTYANMPGNTYDWVGVSAAGSPDTSYIAWSYLNGQTSGTQAFDGLPGGSYEARAYVNNTYTVLARYSFSIAATPTVSTSASSYTDQQLITLNFTNLPGNMFDWVAVSVAGSPDMSYLQWKFTNGATAGSLGFAALPAGSYEARVYVNNSFTRIATSTFTVTGTTPPPPAVLSTDLPTYTAGQTITLNFSNLPGNTYDWLTIAPAGSPDSAYMQWKYTNGATSGSKPFGGLAAGDYEARAYVNNSFTRIATASFTVTP